MNPKKLKALVCKVAGTLKTGSKSNRLKYAWRIVKKAISNPATIRYQTASGEIVERTGVLDYTLYVPKKGASGKSRPGLVAYFDLVKNDIRSFFIGKLLNIFLV